MERRIFLTNLHPDVDISFLCKEFGKYGKILSASLDHNENFKSLCKGQILFQKSSCAISAIQMNGRLINGKAVTVQLPANKMNPSQVKKSYTKIFVKNISIEWDELDLMNHFKMFGGIRDVQISRNEGKSNGYGFIGFEQHLYAEQAVKEMNNKVIDEKVLRVEPYIPKELRDDLNSNSLDYAKDMLQKSIQHNNLHVKNLPKSTSEMEFKTLFEKFGEITSIKIARNEKGESKGFGFVAFKTETDAKIAQFRMNKFSIGTDILEVNFNQRKEQRLHYLQLLKSEPEAIDLNKKKEQGKKMSRVFPEPIFSFKAKS